MNLQHLTNSFLHALWPDRYFWIDCAGLLSIVATIIIIRLIHGAYQVGRDARLSEPEAE